MARLRLRGWTLLPALTLALVLSACSALPLAVPTPQPTPVATEVPVPTVVIPETPPAIVAFRPLPGQEVAPDAALIELRFDRPMDRASVESALRVTPEVAGEVVWQDERTLQFRPKALALETRYRVSLDVTALSAEGTALGQPLGFAFSTLGPLEVTDLSPAPDATELRGDSPLVVTFNRPIVPVNCTGQPAGMAADCPNLPLELSPQVSGSGFWVNTSVYQFTALPGWDAGRRFTAVLPAGIASVDGATLAEGVTWSFTIAKPRVLTFSPEAESLDQLLETAVRVRFSTPMDPRRHCRGVLSDGAQWRTRAGHTRLGGWRRAAGLHPHAGARARNALRRAGGCASQIPHRYAPGNGAGMAIHHGTLSRTHRHYARRWRAQRGAV